MTSGSTSTRVMDLRLVGSIRSKQTVGVSLVPRRCLGFLLDKDCEDVPRA